MPRTTKKVKKKIKHLTDAQITTLEKTGRVGGVLFATPPLTKVVEYIWNQTNSTVAVPDLKIIIRAKEVIKLSNFYSEQDILGSRNLHKAIVILKCLTPITVEEIKEMDAEEFLPDQPILDVLDEKAKDTGPEGLVIPAEVVIEDDNPHLEKYDEVVEHEKKIDEKRLGKKKRKKRGRRKKKKTIEIEESEDEE